ncbi:condensation domain-containing protein [Streptomyces sp. NPDC007856]|uniref:condensation domain-containing protein n=1 Tax=Streptomyces sp. NPDC007856 TaxID=3364781 RepID=UPI0036B18276
MDPDALVAAPHGITLRYDALRLGLARQEGALVQTVRDPLPIDRLITAKNIKAQSVDQFHRYVALFLTAEATRQWDLEKEYPFRFFLVRYSPTLHVLILGFAHLFFDAESSEITERELWKGYAAPDTDARGQGSSVRFFEPVRDAHGGDTVRQEETYWQSRYPGIPPILQVRDSEFRPIREPVTRHTNVRIGGQELDGLRASTREARHTEFQWVLASYALSVFGLTSQDRLKFSATVNMRNRAQEEAGHVRSSRSCASREKALTHGHALARPPGGPQVPPGLPPDGSPSSGPVDGQVQRTGERARQR